MGKEIIIVMEFWKLESGWMNGNELGRPSAGQLMIWKQAMPDLYHKIFKRIRIYGTLEGGVKRETENKEGCEEAFSEAIVSPPLLSVEEQLIYSTLTQMEIYSLDRWSLEFKHQALLKVATRTQPSSLTWLSGLFPISRGLVKPSLGNLTNAQRKDLKDTDIRTTTIPLK